jgi:6-phosphogluconate dehydrogenase
MIQADLGVWGLGTMGGNLALNAAEKGFTVALGNRTPARAAELAAKHARQPFGPRLLPCADAAAFIAALEPPRRVLLMVPAGAAVDESIELLAPLLHGGDILVDGGNSLWSDSRTRQAALRERHIAFVGMGVSGGEEGARHGPSMMAGGDLPAWARLQPVLERMAAVTDTGPCVALVGPDGAGHFAKMVHNGIEYADMQLLAETWDVLRRGAGLSTAEVAQLFAEWNRGPLESFLLELAARVLQTRDERSGGPLVEQVSDAAAQKGTGRWTVQAALELGVPVPTIAAAVDARTLSAERAARQQAAALLVGPGGASPFAAGRERWIEAARDALHAGRIAAWAQGLRLLAAASHAHEWSVDLAEVLRIWTGGCILRARMLTPMRAAFREQPLLANLALAPEFAGVLGRAQPAWREVVSAGARAGLPLPALSASLAWYDTVRAAELPTNLIQAQRDAFGAHGFVRRDDPAGRPTHASW